MSSALLVDGEALSALISKKKAIEVAAAAEPASAESPEPASMPALVPTLVPVAGEPRLIDMPDSRRSKEEHARHGADKEDGLKIEVLGLSLSLSQNPTCEKAGIQESSQTQSRSLTIDLRMLSWDPTNCNQLSCVGHLYF